MLTLNDGRSELWQWDTGRTLSVSADCTQVHFSNKVFGRSIDVNVVNGMAIIPDILLQTDKELTAWAFVGTPENGYTKISKVLKVNRRNKPADYVFTPPDQTTMGEILDRIEDLENRPSGDVSEEDIQNAVNDYLDKNPVSFEEKDPTVPAWAKQPEKPTYTAAEVGALPVDTPIPEGITPPETAKVGQTIVVKAVDENSKPTEWEAADFPTGGSGGGWKLFAEAELTEEVRVIDFGSNSGGESFPENQELYVYMKTVGCEGNTAKQNVVLIVASGLWRLNEAIWNDTTTKICTGVWLMKPADTPSVVGIGVKNASAVTYSPFNETLDGYITGLRIYVETVDVPFGVGTIIKIYGR